jgi:hypothetical protein
MMECGSNKERQQESSNAKAASCQDLGFSGSGDSVRPAARKYRAERWPGWRSTPGPAAPPDRAAAAAVEYADEAHQQPHRGRRDMYQLGW